MPKNLQKKMDFHSSFCDKHITETYKKRIQKMVIDGQIVCPRCESEKEHKKLQNDMQKQYERQEKFRKYNMMLNHSIVQDETLLNATFDNYLTDHEEERQNKQIVIEAVERLKKGQVFNVVLQGKQGTGKSHLGYAALRELNQEPDLDNKEDYGVSNLFINIEGMLRLIKASFKDKESKYTEQYFIDLLSSVDYLVLDDLGAETGAIDTDKTATDFVQRVLYAITTTRQNKVTFLTTNLSSKVLFNMYDKKLVSRLFKNPKYVIFKESSDKRMTNIPF